MKVIWTVPIITSILILGTLGLSQDVEALTSEELAAVIQPLIDTMSAFNDYLNTIVAQITDEFENKQLQIDSLQTQINALEERTRILETLDWENIFFTQGIDSNEQNLFFLGSSMAAYVNHTFVEDHLKENGQDYEIYNLAIGSDLPRWRVNSIDTIISAKPEVIVYVMGFRDLRAEGEYLDGMTPTPPPSDYPPDSYRNVPYLREAVDYFSTMPTLPSEDLQGIAGWWYNIWPVDTNDINAVAFEEIMSKITANDIQLMIVVNPHHSIYLDSVPDSEFQMFFEFLDNVSLEYDIKIIDLHDRYSDFGIWSDLVHVVYNVNSTIYYEDIAMGILENLD